MELVTPTVSAVLDYDGHRVRFIKGVTLIEVGHPILRGRQHLVRPVRVDFPVTVDADITAKPKARTRKAPAAA